MNPDRLFLFGEIVNAEGSDRTGERAMSGQVSGRVGVCNAALIKLGANTINSFDELTLEAKACNALWDIQRRAVLRLHPWNFAIKRSDWVAANQSGGLVKKDLDAPMSKEYRYAYTMPTNALKLLKVIDDMNYRREGRDILTNKEECHIKYIDDVTDTAEWDSLFVDLMVARMARELAYTLPRTRTMIDAMNGLYQEALSLAKANDAAEDIEDALDQSMPELIAVRYGRG